MQLVKLSVFILCSLLTSSCKSISQRSRAEVKTGDFNVENSLVNLPAGVPVQICNRLGQDIPNATEGLDLIKTSIREWAKTIDFTEAMNATESCEVAEGKVISMITVSYSSQNDPSADVCVALGANYVVYRTINVAWARSFSPYRHEIVLCDRAIAVAKDVIFHEVGHLFGNCDQYLIEAGKSFATQRLQHPYCGRRFGSGNGECSAMNATGHEHPQVVTRADCEIMQQMGRAYGKTGAVDKQGVRSFKAICSEYPGPEKCGILAGNAQSTAAGQESQTEQQPKGPCPAGYYLGVDGFCHLTQQAPQSPCPPGKVLYTDGLCR